MSPLVHRLLVCSVAILSSAGVALAQADVTASSVLAPFHVAFVEGSTTAIRAGEQISLAAGEPVVDGDRLQTAAGRAELRGPDGERLFLDQGSTLDVLQPPVFRLVTGAARIVLDAPARPDGTPAIEIDTPHATAALFEAGDYRVTILQRPGGDETELIVRAGRGELVNMYGRVSAVTRERVAVSAFGAPSAPEPVTARDLVDSFDRWVDVSLSGSAPTDSAAYLPSGLASYSAALDTAGSWSYEPTYGHVWYPTVVVDWQPYYHGFWRPLGYYGYTWISHTPWAWATHHYGRWEFGARGWFWIPGGAWGGAWVSWGVGPGYVAWCPLGWRNRPVYPVPFGRRGGAVPYRTHGPRGGERFGGGWTVLRSEHFRSARPVSRHAVDWRSIDPSHQVAFVQQQTPPRASLAVPRGSLSAARASAGDRVASGGRGLRSPGVTDGTAVGTSGVAVGRTPARGSMTGAGAREWSSPSRRVGTATGATGRAPTTTTRALSGRVPTRANDAAPGTERLRGGDRRRSGLTAPPGVDRAPQRAEGASPSRSEAQPRWTPPATRYGTPPAVANPRSWASPTLGRRNEGDRGTVPGYVRPRTSPRVVQPAPPSRSRSTGIERGSATAIPRAPAMRAPAVRSAPSRPQGGQPSAPSVGRAPAGSAAPARGQGAPRAASPRRPPGR